MRYFKLDANRCPVACSELDWISNMHDKENDIASDMRADYLIRTCFVGLSQQVGYGDPLLFQTDVYRHVFALIGIRNIKKFVSTHSYITWEQASYGHARIVAEIDAKITQARSDVQRP